jgi:hypothetical protein
MKAALLQENMNLYACGARFCILPLAPGRGAAMPSILAVMRMMFVSLRKAVSRLSSIESTPRAPAARMAFLTLLAQIPASRDMPDSQAAVAPLRHLVGDRG